MYVGSRSVSVAGGKVGTINEIMLFGRNSNYEKIEDNSKYEKKIFWQPAFSALLSLSF